VLGGLHTQIAITMHDHCFDHDTACMGFLVRCNVPCCLAPGAFDMGIIHTGSTVHDECTSDPCVQ
jgi:hypothetical protein